MKPVTQSKTGKDGRCFPACLASILEIPENSVPDLDNTNKKQVDSFLSQHGLEYARVPTDIKPAGYHVIEGISLRGGAHAVVGLDGRLIHDPHPQDGTGRGLVQVDNYGLLLPTRRR